MANSSPYTWEPLSPEDAATVKRCYGDLGTAQELLRCLEIFCLKCSSLVLLSFNDVLGPSLS